MISNILSTIAVLLVVPPILNLLASGKDKEQPTDRFDVYNPSLATVIFAIAALINTIGIIFFLKAYSPGEEYHSLGYACAIYAIGLASATFISGFDRIKVRGDRLHIRTAFPPCLKTITFDDIRAVSVDSDGGLILDINGKNLRVDRDAVGIRELKERCRHKPEGRADSGTVTRAKLLFSETLLFMGGLFIFLIFPFAWAMSGWFDALVGTLVLVGSIMLCCFIIPLGGYIKLRRMEKFLGCDFNSEMKELGMTSSNFTTKDWFVRTDFLGVVALRRDYVKSAGELSEENGKITFELLTADNRRMKIGLNRNSAEEFKRWIRG